MSQTRYLLGGAALAGAGYYVYQQRLEQSQITAQQQDSLRNKLPSFGSGSNDQKLGEGAGQYTGRKIDEAANQARDKFDGLKYDANKQLDKGLSQAEQERARLAGWANDKVANAQDRLDQAESDAQKKASLFSKDAHKDDPKGLNKLGKDIEKEAEHAKSSVLGSLTNAKDSIIGTKNDAENKAQEAVDKTKSTAQDLQKNAQNQVNEAENKASGWFSSAQDKAESNVNAVKANVEQGKKSFWSGWFGAKDETKESIDHAYEEAQKLYDDAERRYNETKKGWLTWNKDDEKEKLHKEAQRQLDDAQKNLDSAQARFKHWQEKAKETVSNAADKLTPDSSSSPKPKSNGFYDWLRGGDSSSVGTTRGLGDEQLAKRTQQGLRGWGESAEEFSKDRLDEVQGNSNKNKSWGIPGWFSSNKSDQAKSEEIAQRAQKGLRGWGESAEQFSKDEYDDVKRQADKKQAELDAKLKEWSAWTNKKYADSVQGAEEYYKDAQDAVTKAKKEVEENSSGWFSWGKDKSKELELEAKKNLEDSQSRLNDATTNLKKWTNETSQDASVKFWSSADGAIHQAKNGLDRANENVQQGLTDARSYVQDKK